MKPPHIQAPKCVLISILYFIFPGHRSHMLTGLVIAPCDIVVGQLTSESPFRIIESSRS